MHVFFSFWISIYHSFSIFQNALKLVQKRTLVLKRTPWKNHTKYSQLILIYLQYLQTYIWVSVSKHFEWVYRRHSVHCIHFSSHALDFANPSQNAKNVFVFGGAFPITVFESPSSSESALLCTSESLCIFFDFCFVFFFSVHFCTTVRFVRSKRKKKENKNYLRNS